jgi:Flp pilus assembly pilin Flp
MTRWVAVVKSFFAAQEAGATLAEYSLLLLFIASVTLAGMSLLGSALSRFFATAAASI